MQKFDLVVIGSGSGGSVAAKYAARLGASVALVEKTKDTIGGENVQGGSVTSKAFIAASSWPDSDWKTVKDHIDKSVASIRNEKENPVIYSDFGVEIFYGEAVLLEDNVVKVGKTKLKARRIIIASGSKAKVPSIPGLKAAGYDTHETALHLKSLPSSVCIIGGGPVALEMATAFIKLGSNVTILEHNSHILKRADSEAVQLVERNLRAAGAQIITSCSVLKVSRNLRSYSISVRHGGRSVDIKSKCLIVAAGRSPVIPKGVKKRDVLVSADGIKVDSDWRTDNKKIYAIGDVVDCEGHSSNMASSAGYQAVAHALYGIRSRVGLDSQPCTIFTDPQISQVGASPALMEYNGIMTKVYTLPYSDIDQAIVSDYEGFIKLVVSPKGRILGGVVVGECANEIIGYISMAVAKKADLNYLANLTPAYPSLASGLKDLAIDARLDLLKDSKNPLTILRKVRAIF